MTFASTTITPGPHPGTISSIRACSPRTSFPALPSGSQDKGRRRPGRFDRLTPIAPNVSMDRSDTHPRRPRGSSALVVGSILAALASAGGAPAASAQSDATPHRNPTFTRDVAPILFENCASCHRPGGSGPFSVLSYESVHPHAEAIAEQTRSRRMPPWLPSGDRTFEGERRLQESEIDLLQRWASAGAPEGARAHLPAPPAPTPAWPLGEPDLILEAPEYMVPPEGRDLYRNLVLPVTLDSLRFVRAVDLRPGARAAVHHARLMVDTTGLSRKKDAADAGPGFDGMEGGTHARNPPGHFVGWTPGRVPHAGYPEMAWPLVPGSDLVLQLHLRPDGRSPVVRSRVGLYLADAPPSRPSALVSLGTEIIDIPPGESAHLVSDTFRLPVPVTVLSVYPHAHYLGKTMEGLAHLPGGDTETLIRIDDWDFDWQDEYRLARPLELPAGTLLEMRFTYDNSADNPQNPHHPPRRVRYGSTSTDEMADLLVQVAPANADNAQTLELALSRKYARAAVAWAAWNERTLAAEAAERGDRATALHHYRASLRNQEDARVLLAMAGLVLEDGDAASAVVIAERAAEVSRHRDPRVLEGLAVAYLAAGRRAMAEDALERALARARALGDEDFARTLEGALERLRAGANAAPARTLSSHRWRTGLPAVSGSRSAPPATAAGCWGSSPAPPARPECTGRGSARDVSPGWRDPRAGGGHPESPRPPIG